MKLTIKRPEMAPSSSLLFNVVSLEWHLLYISNRSAPGMKVAKPSSETCSLRTSINVEPYRRTLEWVIKQLHCDPVLERQSKKIRLQVLELIDSIDHNFEQPSTYTVVLSNWGNDVRESLIERQGRIYTPDPTWLGILSPTTEDSYHTNQPRIVFRATGVGSYGWGTRSEMIGIARRQLEDRIRLHRTRIEQSQHELDSLSPPKPQEPPPQPEPETQIPAEPPKSIWKHLAERN